MPLKGWINSVNKKFPTPKKVDRDMLEHAASQVLVMGGSVRLMTGRVMTDDEIRHRREEGMEPLTEG
jgi:hypothetical protein